MGCGCGGSGTVARSATAMPRSVASRDPMACMRCYAKHLAKAAVQAGEVEEDPSRARELAMCVGNIACAEDHAMALGMGDERAALRRIRSMVWTNASYASRELWSLAESASASVVAEEARKRERPSSDGVKGGASDAGRADPATDSNG